MSIRAGLFLVASVALAACSSETPASPTPAVAVATPEATAATTPSATPFDVAKAFLPQIVAATAGKLEISGALDVGGVTGGVSGTIAYNGSDSDELLKVAIGATPSATASIHKAGIGYTKLNDGPWLQDAVAPKVGNDLGTLLTGLLVVIDKGIETKGGVALHRLELPAGTVLDPAAFGLTAANIVNPTAELVFYADETGKPAYISVTARWTQSGRPVTMTLDYHYVQVGGSVTVISPAVWSVFTSKRYGFRMAYPPDWDASVSDKSEDVFISPIDAENVFAYRYKSDGFTLNQFVQELVRYNKAHRYPLRTNVAFTLAGKKARLLTFRGALSDGTKVVAYSVLALNGVWVYELDWFSPVGLEVTDLATFKEMLGTFAYKL